MVPVVGSPQRVLFETDLLRASDYRCRGHDGRDEVAADHEIVLPRIGSYIRRDASGETVADANHVLFFHRGQSFDIHHPWVGGDRSTDFALKGEAALELVRHFDPGVADRPERPFPAGEFTLSGPGVGLALSRLTAAAGADPLQLEEQALLLLGSLLRQVFGGSDRTTPAQPDQSGHPQMQNGRSAQRRATRPNGHADQHQAARRVKLLLHQGLSRPIGLKPLAQQVGYSPYHLCRIFRRQTGLTIHRYLQHLRLRESLELLVEDPQRSVAEIAVGLGFASHSHFSTAFLGAFAQSPRAFRRRVNGQRLQELRKILKD
jgi:AraC-like DNA-binding protein